MFNEILSIIHNSDSTGFEESCVLLEDCINSDSDFVGTLRQTGIIPESIAHDSTQEKLFSKASDFVLSRAFRELGLKSAAIKARADSADVLADSVLYGYSLVSDAKAFRLTGRPRIRRISRFLHCQLGARITITLCCALRISSIQLKPVRYILRL